MVKEIYCNKELKPCPFCGSEVEVEKVPLWNGSHGYHGSYEFVIRCKSCGGRTDLLKNDTVYRGEEEALNNAVAAWNRRSEVNEIKRLQEENEKLKKLLDQEIEDKYMELKSKINEKKFELANNLIGVEYDVGGIKEQ